jgi:hypothetical protein
MHMRSRICDVSPSLYCTPLLAFVRSQDARTRACGREASNGRMYLTLPGFEFGHVREV